MSLKQSHGGLLADVKHSVAPVTNNAYSNWGSVVLSNLVLKTPESPWRLALGVAPNYGPDYFGSSRYKSGAVPLISVFYKKSARSGLPQYAASAGLRDVSISASLNYRVTDHWTALGRLSVTQLLGDAAASPITLSKGQLSIIMGLGYRFF